MLSFHETPFNRALKFEIVRQDEVATEVSMPVDEWLTQENGVVHGGIIASLADTAAVHALAGSLNESERMTGIEFKINFLRPTRLDGGNLVARAAIVKRGKTISLCEVDVRQNGEIVAKGLFTYIVLPATVIR
jgi:uncharacterized protein (TIGR00369 family)